MKIVFIVHVVSTWALIGLIWTIQQVHYPLFERVGTEYFTAYERAHMARISILVIPLMLIELITAFWLTINPPKTIPRTIFIIALLLTLIIWFSTALINLPQHVRLAGEFNQLTVHALVQSNWVRTITWTLRGLILSWVLWHMIDI